MKKAKLQLIKHTIRCLQNHELVQARGGAMPSPERDGPVLDSSVCRVDN